MTQPNPGFSHEAKSPSSIKKSCTKTNSSYTRRHSRQHWFSTIIKIDSVIRNLPKGVFKQDVIVCFFAAVGFCLFWEFQYLFEVRVMKSKVQKAQEDYFFNLPRYIELLKISNNPIGSYNLTEKLKSIPAFSDPISVNRWLDSLKIYSQGLRIFDDTTFIQQLTNRLEQTIKTMNRIENSIGNKIFFWWAGLIFSFAFGLVMLIIILILQRVQKLRVEDGQIFAHPIPLLGVFLPFVALTLLMLLFVWGRDITDVYWVWFLPYGAVLAAFAGAKDAPIRCSDKAKIESVFKSKSQRDNKVKRYISWATFIVDQEKQVAGWVLSIVLALSSSTLYGILQPMKTRVTPEGMHYIAIEYVLLSVYIWSVGIFGVFFRYLTRVKILQKILLGP